MKPTALVFQTHLFDRGIARHFARFCRQCPPHYSPFVLMHLPPGSPRPRRLTEVPHHFVTTDAIRAMPYPRKTAVQDWTGRSWDLWGGGHCARRSSRRLRRRPRWRRREVRQAPGPGRGCACP